VVRISRMNSDYVSINLKHKRRSWKWYEFAAWLCLCAFSIVGIHTTILNLQTTGSQEFQIGTDLVNLNPNEIDSDMSEEAVGKKLTPVNDLSREQPRLFVIAFECQPEQVEFVQHLITNVALLANENRDIPDATGQAETFISYEAFASTRPITSCDQLFLVEAYPNEASQRIHGRAAYKNGLEIMQVLRGTKPENGLPGFNFAKKGLMKTYACKSDCRAEIRQVKLELIRAEREKRQKSLKEKTEKKKEEADDTVHIITGGIGGHEVTTYKKVKQKSPEEMMTENTRKEFVEKKKGAGKKKEQKKTVTVEGDPKKYRNEEREEDLAPLTHHLRGSASKKTRKKYVKQVFGQRYEDDDQEPTPQQEVSPMIEFGGMQDRPMIIHEKHERQIIPVHAEDTRSPPDHEPRGEIFEDDQPDPQRAGEIIVVRDGGRSQPQIVHMLHHQIHHRYEDDDVAREHHENHVIYSREDPDSSESHAEHSQHVVYELQGDDSPPNGIIEKHFIREAGGE